MTEPIFKAPLPPQGNGFTSPQPQEPKKEQEEQNQNVPQDLKQKILPYLWYVLGGCFFLGLIFGIMMSGGDSAPPAQECPLKYVRNPDIQKAYPLCGRTSNTNECVLFIMNTSRYDAYAEDFFQRAADLTERSRILISTDNPTYSKLNIPPGYFAQIKIPSTR